MKKSQTATEYLIILGVVITIAIITVGTLSDVIGLSDGSDERSARLNLLAQSIAVTDYAVSDYDTVLVLRNNHDETVLIDEIWVDNKQCLFFYNTIYRLNPGESENIICQNVYELDDESVEYAVLINWTDTKTGLTFTQSDSDLFLVGNVVDKYLNSIQSNGYWNGSSNDGCYNASQDPIPICTCIDLNKTRNDLSSNHILLNSIDFQRCAQEFSSAESLAFNWTPIGFPSSNYAGVFDGSEFIIKSMRISGLDRLGLFRSGDNGVFQNLGVVDYTLSSSSSLLGSIVGQGSFLVMTNSFSSGSANGSATIGGLIGSGDYINISNSYSIFTANNSGSNLGGLIGASYRPRLVNTYSDIDLTGYGLIGAGGYSTISNSYSKGRVNGTERGIGGLAGEVYVATISNNYVLTKVYCSDAVNGWCGGLIGVNDTSTTFTNNEWIDYSDDVANGCVGRPGNLAGMNISGCLVSN